MNFVCKEKVAQQFSLDKDSMREKKSGKQERKRNRIKEGKDSEK